MSLLHRLPGADVAQNAFLPHALGVTGASSSTRAVSVINANWAASAEGGDGAFSFLVVTDDGERHVIEPSPAAAAALLALFASPATLLWDPASRTVIAGGVRGTWFD